MILNRDSILSADDLKREMVTVPEWGGDVYVSEMTAAEQDRFSAELLRADKEGGHPDNFRARYLAATLCDEQGNRLFSDTDVVELGRKSFAVIDRLFGIAQRTNGVTKEAAEEIEKN